MEELYKIDFEKSKQGGEILEFLYNTHTDLSMLIKLSYLSDDDMIKVFQYYKEIALSFRRSTKKSNMFLWGKEDEYEIYMSISDGRYFHDKKNIEEFEKYKKVLNENNPN